MTEVMDTTLRDGEQMEGGNFTPSQKLQIAEILFSIGVNRVEVTSACLNARERNGFAEIMKWAKKRSLVNKIEVLGFVDGNKSVDWITSAGGKVLNLLTKGSAHHLSVQLRQTLQEHISAISRTVGYANACGLKVNVYLEDWSNGIKDSPEHVFALVRALGEIPVGRIMLCDTLGVLSTSDTSLYVAMMIKAFPNIQFDFHAHNDYGLATANTIAAVKAGVTGVHATVNGLGERTGNAPLDETVAGIHDHTNNKTSIKETELRRVSTFVAMLSGRKIPPNKPITGRHANTSAAGVHADGDLKGKLYISKLTPERFGGKTAHVLGKLGGRASITSNLKELGFDLTNEQIKKISSLIDEMIERGHHVDQCDLSYLAAEVLGGDMLGLFEIISAKTTSNYGGEASALINFKWKGKSYSTKSRGTGGFDATVKAIRVAGESIGFTVPEVVSYDVDIPTDTTSEALVRAIVTWRVPNGNDFYTSGLSPDQVIAGIRALQSAINIANANKQ